MVFGMGGSSNTMEVKINGDASGLKSAIAAGAIPAIGNLNRAVAGFGLAMSGLAAGGLAGSVKAADNWHDAVIDMEKVLPSGEIGDLDDKLMDLAKTVPLPTTQLADLAAQAARFGVPEQNILDFVETTAKIAASTDVPIESAGESFAKLATLTGTPISDIDKLGNVINMLGQTTETSANEVVQSALNASGTLSAMGMSTPDILGLAASFNTVFDDSSKAGRALKRVGQEMMDPRKVEDLAMALGLTPDEFKRMREEDPTGLMLMMADTMAEGGDGAEILNGTLSSFSRTALNQVAPALQKTRDNLKNANDEWATGNSVNKEFAKEMEKLGPQIQILKNGLFEIGVTIGQNLLPPLIELVKKVIGVIEIFSVWNERSNGTLAMFVLLGTFIGGLIPVFGLLVMSIGPLLPLLAGLAKLILGLVWPIGLAIAAIVLLTMAWQNNWFGIQEVTAGVITWIRESIGLLFAWLVEFTNTMLTAAREFWAMYGEQITEIVMLWVQVITEAVRGFFEFINPYVEQMLADAALFWSMYGDEIMGVVDFFVDYIKGVFEFFLDFLRTAALVTLDLMHGDWEEAWNKIKDFFFDTLDGILAFAEKWFVDLVRHVSDSLADALQAFIDWGRDLIGGSVIPDIFNDIMSFVTGWFGDFLSDVAGFLTDLLSDFTEKFTDIANKVKEKATEAKDFATDAFTALKDQVTDVVDDLKSDVETAFKEIATKVKEKSNEAKQKAISAFNTLKSRVLGIVNTLKSRVTSAFNSIKNAASNVISKARNAASRARSIISNAPTRVGNFFGMQHGGLVTGPTFAMIGEGSEDEAVLPLSKLNTLVERAAMTGATHGGGGGPGSVNQFNITVNAETPTGGRLAGRALVRELRSHNFD